MVTETDEMSGFLAGVAVKAVTASRGTDLERQDFGKELVC